MCGIVGVLNRQTKPQMERLRASLRLIEHRGPDGDGVWANHSERPPYVAFGHRRLAIIDLSDAGAQPMSNDEGQLWITYNGEIYNYLELMGELEGRGHRFRSKSDTEVILRAYEEWGEACLERFNGMFAFAIWDERKQRLFAARDRFGEKPFHYAWNRERGFFAFSSEIKALLAMPEVERGLDDRALYRFVAFQELAGAEQTLWQGVRRLPHAHYLLLTWKGERFDLTIQRYWDIDLERTAELSLQVAAARFAELFADSVRLRLRSDVPVGTSLSGGLDSSAIVCQIHALGAAGGQKTFSARMEEAALDEGHHIAAVLAKTGVEGHEVWPSSAELQSCFSKLCYHLEEPFPTTSMFAQFLVMRLASEQGVTVLLDGQGADEILAGYRHYFRTRYAEMADRWQLLSLWTERHAFQKKHVRDFPLSMKALLARLSPGLYRFSKNGTTSGQPYHSESTVWWRDEWLAEFADEPPPELPIANRDVLTRKLYADAMRGELQELLRYGDRNSMAWSRELRVPFLDHRLVEFLFTLPVHYKLHQGETKVLLREASKGLLPESIRRRQDKLGYQAPLIEWLSRSLTEWVEQRFEDLAPPLIHRVTSNRVEQIRKLSQTMREPDGRAVFSLLTLAEAVKQMQNLRPSNALSC